MHERLRHQWNHLIKGYRSLPRWLQIVLPIITFLFLVFCLLSLVTGHRQRRKKKQQLVRSKGLGLDMDDDEDDDDNSLKGYPEILEETDFPEYVKQKFQIGGMKDNVVELADSA